MATPFSVFVRKMCLLRGVRLKVLAYDAGVDPSYLSAFLNGKKAIPGEAVLRSMEISFHLSEEEKADFRKAVRYSQLKYELPGTTNPEEFAVVWELMNRIGTLQPGQLKAIEAILKI